jgi:hypothetical protein
MLISRNLPIVTIENNNLNNSAPPSFTPEVIMIVYRICSFPVVGKFQLQYIHHWSIIQFTTFFPAPLHLSIFATFTKLAESSTYSPMIFILLHFWTIERYPTLVDKSPTARRPGMGFPKISGTLHSLIW